MEKKVLILAYAILLYAGLFLSSCSGKMAQSSSPFDLDSNYSPQSDFYHYVNMHYIKEYRLIDRSAVRSELKTTIENYYNNLQKLHEELLDANDDQLNFLQLNAKYLYQSALDSNLIEEDGDQAIRFLIDAIPSKNDLEGFADYLALKIEHGCYAPIHLEVENFYELDKRYPCLVNYYIPLYSWDSAEENIDGKQFFKTYTNEMHSGLGYNKEEMQEKQADIIEIDSVLYHLLSKDQTNSKGELMTVNALQKKAPDFNWLRFFNQLGIESKDTIVVKNLTKIQSFSKVIKKFSDKQWHNYFEFNVYDSYAFVLNKKFREPSYNYNYKMGKINIKIDDSWNNFKNLILNYYMAGATSKLYYDRFCHPESKQDVQNIANKITSTFIQTIKECKWIDESTRAIALDKINRVHFQIFYPEDLSHYEKLQTKKQSLVRNFLKISRNHFSQILMRDKYAKIDYSKFFYQMDFYYPFAVANKHIVFIPVSFNETVYYRKDAELYQNYAGIGTKIGHEISHILDANPDMPINSEINEDSWWGPKTRANILDVQKKTIIQHHYFSSMDYGRSLNNYELYEQLGEISGLMLAHIAFSKEVNLQSKEKEQPFTKEQLFFLHYAKTHRGYFDISRVSPSRDDFYFIANDSRVNGMLANFPQFQKAFNIKPGDKMYLPDSLKYVFW